MTDDRLMDEVGELLARVDPVPPGVTLAARSALAWRRMDAGLAELLEDAEAALAVRSDGGFRILIFEAPDGYGIELEVARPDETTRTILGQLLPPEPAAVVVRHGETTTEVTADELGRFRAEGVPAGPVSIRVAFEGNPVETGWITL